MPLASGNSVADPRPASGCPVCPASRAQRCFRRSKDNAGGANRAFARRILRGELPCVRASGKSATVQFARPAYPFAKAKTFLRFGEDPDGRSLTPFFGPEKMRFNPRDPTRSTTGNIWFPYIAMAIMPSTRDPHASAPRTPPMTGHPLAGRGKKPRAIATTVALCNRSCASRSPCSTSCSLP